MTATWTPAQYIAHALSILEANEQIRTCIIRTILDAVLEVPETEDKLTLWRTKERQALLTRLLEELMGGVKTPLDFGRAPIDINKEEQKKLGFTSPEAGVEECDALQAVVAHWISIEARALADGSLRIVITPASL